MNGKFSHKTGKYLVIVLVLVLALSVQASPAYAGLVTSPTIQLSVASVWQGFSNPITIIAGLGTSPTTPIKGATLGIYVDSKLIGTGTTDDSGRVSLGYDPSGLLLGSHTVEVRFIGGTINSIEYYSSSTSTLFIVEGFSFNGFFSPVTMELLNNVNAGRTVPIKWKLIGNVSGNYVSDLSVVKNIETGETNCGSDAVNMITEVDTSGSSGLRYDLEANQFIYTFQTEKAWAGTCRRFLLTLIDETTYVVDFRFK